MITLILGLEPATIHCALPVNASMNTSLPCDEGEGATCVYSQCEVYTNFSNTFDTTEPCPNGWTYSDDVHSIVNEVCNIFH